MGARRSLKLIAAMLVAIAGVTLSGAASADHGHGHAHFGVWIGGPLWGPWYPWYPPSYYYPPYPPPAPPGPVTYIENGSAAAQAPAANYWYYCRKPEGYYPHVQQCSGEWEKVPAQPAQ